MRLTDEEIEALYDTFEKRIFEKGEKVINLFDPLEFGRVIADAQLAKLPKPPEGLREAIQKILVDECPFVDNCKRQCTPTAQETCWDKHTNRLLSLIQQARADTAREIFEEIEREIKSYEHDKRKLIKHYGRKDAGDYLLKIYTQAFQSLKSRHQPPREGE